MHFSQNNFAESKKLTTFAPLLESNAPKKALQMPCKAFGKNS